ncbi:hydroxyisourate hydrolase [Granulosicoccus sp.]|nr:hydroxyisourate hydrolase [Granulosicoccus sp.]MDB4224273.1 hydroxyisourate hydrolase [Granulosicoccus sp.]
MATISSHVLDSVVGGHAAGIRVECLKRLATGEQTQVFDVFASEQGRISEVVEISSSAKDEQYELVFHSKSYFSQKSANTESAQILECVVIRLSLVDPNGSYHVPIMLAPHSYSVWWSGFEP